MISSFDIDHFCVFLCLINWDVDKLTIFFHACMYILFQQSSPVLNSECDTILVTI